MSDHLSSSSQAHKDGVLQQLLCGENKVYDYDLIVIGGGSGGLACSKVRASQITLLKPTLPPDLHLSSVVLRPMKEGCKSSPSLALSENVTTCTSHVSSVLVSSIPLKAHWRRGPKVLPLKSLEMKLGRRKQEHDC